MTTINQTSIFELYVVRRGIKKGHQKYLYLKEIELHAQNLLSILDSKVNMIAERIRPLNGHENLHFDNG